MLLLIGTCYNQMHERYIFQRNCSALSKGKSDTKNLVQKKVDREGQRISAVKG